MESASAKTPLSSVPDKFSPFLGAPGAVFSLLPMTEPFDQMGEDGFAALVAAFYRRVKYDTLVGGLYPPDDWEGSEARLRDFLIFRFGGSTRYIEERGHPRLRARHFPFAIGLAERDRWLEMMSAAMDETAIPEDCRHILDAFFSQTADFMRNVEETPETGQG